MNYPSIRIEGAILSPDLLDRIEELPGQRPADFNLPTASKVKDEIARAWADAQDYWRIYQRKLDSLREESLATTETRQQWMVPLLGLLGYQLDYQAKAAIIQDKTYAISHRVANRGHTPFHIIGYNDPAGLDRKPDRSTGPRMSAHALVQEYLNLSDELYALVTNGRVLRLLRDSSRLIKLTYLEFDLDRIFTDGLFADFAVLYRLLHASRMPSSVEATAECLIERYHQDSLEEGARIRDGLSSAVEEIVGLISNGFLSHRGNEAFRDAIRSGELTARDYYRQILRLVYRLLFLMVAEDRGLIFPEKATRQQREIYWSYYSLQRLRRLSERTSYLYEAERSHDLWLSLIATFRLFRADGPGAKLGLAPFDGQLFRAGPLDRIEALHLDNRTLTRALHKLSFFQHPSSGQWVRINYAALNTEEFGSVYEGLLECSPVFDQSPLSFRLRQAAGNQRKTSGSYYTPDVLVEQLQRTALIPMLEARIKQAAQGKRNGERQQAIEQAILSLKICDPACGSGHFLLSAAHRVARELALIRANGDEPSPSEQRRALREVITRCIFGVDVNEMAVELCKVTLWIESAEPGKPLSFLDHHIKVGNSLLGANPARIREGIPDDAYKPLTGDDKKAVAWMKKLNKDHRGKAHVRGQRSLDFGDESPWERLGNLPSAIAQMETTPDDSVATVAAKEKHYAELVAGTGYLHARLLFDTWCAAFVWPKDREEWGTELHTRHLRQIEKSPYELDAQRREAIPTLARDYAFFHWHLEFPTVFREPAKDEKPENKLTGLKGGFDCILGNPPWEHIELKESEWFADVAPEIANAAGAKRKKLIEELPQSNPDLHARYFREIRAINGTRHILSNSGNYPFCGRGRVNLYTVFAEQFRNLLNPQGRAGCVLPTGIATDDTTKFFFQDVVQRKSLVSLYDFENRRKLFRDVDSRMKFCLFTVGSGTAPAADQAEFAFFCLEVADLEDEERRFTLKPEDIELLNPNTGNCPIFRGKRDAELTKHIYRRVPVLCREAKDGQPEQNPWQLSFKQGLFNMTSDSHHFRTAAELRDAGYTRSGNVFSSPYDRYLPLYEAKMIHHFDHRWATYEERPDGSVDSRDVTLEEKQNPDFVVQPRYWVREEVVESALPHYPEQLWKALQEDDHHAIHRAMFLWVIGHYMEIKDQPNIEAIIRQARQSGVEVPLFQHEAGDPIYNEARSLQKQYPLEDSHLEVFRNAEDQNTIPQLAHQWVQEFSPKWLMGWRDITNTTNERTTIASVVPRVAVGHTAPLFLSHLWQDRSGLDFISNLTSFAADFIARQKVGGTHLTYGLIKQLVYLRPGQLGVLTKLIRERTLELLYTSSDLSALATDCGYDGPPFPWDEERRFQIRCELDAAFFHLYLPALPDGSWKPCRIADGDVADESSEELVALRRCFATPRDAVAYIMDTFPIVRRKDEQAYSHYRTKDRILEVYDEMQKAEAAGKEWQSPLDPPPGVQAGRTGDPSLASVPSWRDEALSVSHSRPSLDAKRYRSLAVEHLLAQSGSHADFTIFRRAYWLLANPAKFAEIGKTQLPEIPQAWWQSRNEVLDKTVFVSHLRDAASIGDLRLWAEDGERRIAWCGQPQDADVHYPHVRDDARIALVLAEHWQDDEASSEWQAMEPHVAALFVS